VTAHHTTYVSEAKPLNDSRQEGDGMNRICGR
jgi:hypothetical protein